MSIPSPFHIGGFVPVSGDIVFMPTTESPWRVAMLVIHNEENDFWELRKVEHDELRALNRRAYDAAIERTSSSPDAGFSLRVAA